MGVAFDADTVSVELDDTTPNVTFRAARSDEEHKLMFVRSPTDEPEEYVVKCACDQVGEFPMIMGVLLTPTRVVVTYKTDRPGEKPREFVVGHQVTGEDLKTLRRGMRKVFRSTGVFVDDAATGFGLLKAILIGPPTPTSELLVVPTYLTAIGVVGGGVMAGAANPWLTPLGMLAGGALGFLYGCMQRWRFYSMHKYQ